MDGTSTESGFDPGTYGRSFADVYDHWYPADSSTDAAVERISRMCGGAGRILELGAGTGRIAIPLAVLGHEVVGMDSSDMMLQLLKAKAAEADLGITVVCGDAGRRSDWPDGEFDVVVAAFNLVFNLGSEPAQRRAFSAAADALSDNGRLVVEAFIPASPDDFEEPPGDRSIERTLEVRSVRADSVVMIATEWDHASGSVTGQHIELRDGEPVRLRPWHIRVAPPDEIDTWAEAADLVLSERFGDWSGREFDPRGAAHVSVYSRRRN